MVVPTILCINLYKLHWAKPKATDVLKKSHSLARSRRLFMYKQQVLNRKQVNITFTLSMCCQYISVRRLISSALTSLFLQLYVRCPYMRGT